MACDGGRVGVESFEGRGERGVAVGGGPEEAVVGSGPLGCLPDALERGECPGDGRTRSRASSRLWACSSARSRAHDARAWWWRTSAGNGHPWQGVRGPRRDQAGGVWAQAPRALARGTRAPRGRLSGQIWTRRGASTAGLGATPSALGGDRASARGPARPLQCGATAKHGLPAGSRRDRRGAEVRRPRRPHGKWFIPPGRPRRPEGAVTAGLLRHPAQTRAETFFAPAGPEQPKSALRVRVLLDDEVALAGASIRLTAPTGDRSEHTANAYGEASVFELTTGGASPTPFAPSRRCAWARATIRAW